jgi:hypothetical protein
MYAACVSISYSICYLAKSNLFPRNCGTSVLRHARTLDNGVHLKKKVQKVPIFI